jgi:hypothetical protein
MKALLTVFALLVVFVMGCPKAQEAKPQESKQSAARPSSPVVTPIVTPSADSEGDEFPDLSIQELLKEVDYSNLQLDEQTNQGGWHFIARFDAPRGTIDRLVKMLDTNFKTTENRWMKQDVTFKRTWIDHDTSWWTPEELIEPVYAGRRWKANKYVMLRYAMAEGKTSASQTRVYLVKISTD